MAFGGRGVKEAAGRALDGTIGDVNQFLNEVQFQAWDDDDRVRLSQLMAQGGPEVKKVAGLALDGTMEDVHQFLQYGYRTAAAHDQETLTVSQLANLTKNASTQAGQQSPTAGSSPEQPATSPAPEPWRLQWNDTNGFMLVNVKSDRTAKPMCLDVPGHADPTPGLRLGVYPCHPDPGDDQWWAFT
ncbi:hypothetical protein [Kitasatospora sp. NPDC090091]|uniref:hypothetical protein n=1 Tax=Kitasatospora sp. NPDC090091 TaxID=3364081 RepID=UPI0038276DA3